MAGWSGHFMPPAELSLPQLEIVSDRKTTIFCACPAVTQTLSGGSAARNCACDHCWIQQDRGPVSGICHPRNPTRGQAGRHGTFCIVYDVCRNSAGVHQNSIECNGVSTVHKTECDQPMAGCTAQQKATRGSVGSAINVNGTSEVRWAQRPAEFDVNF